MIQKVPGLRGRDEVICVKSSLRCISTPANPFGYLSIQRSSKSFFPENWKKRRRRRRRLIDSFFHRCLLPSQGFSPVFPHPHPPSSNTFRLYFCSDLNFVRSRSDFHRINHPFFVSGIFFPLLSYLQAYTRLCTGCFSRGLFKN